MNPADYNLSLPHYTNRSSYEDYRRDNRTDNFKEQMEMIKKMSFTLYSIISALGIIGNGLVIWIAGFRMKKTIRAVWFLNLAIADFLCCTLPLRIADWVFFYQHNEDLSFCISSVILFTLNMTSSVLLLTAMSIDHCVSIMWPFWAQVHRTRRLVRITAGVIWVWSFLLSVLLFFLYILFSGDFTEWCQFYFPNTIYEHKKLAIKLIRLVIMFLIPFLIILTSYLIIFIKLRKSKRPPRSQRPYRIITAVILCFFFCWFPYYIWPLIPLYDEGGFQFDIVNTIIIILACLNSCINPIIYVFMGQDFRQGFFRSIPARVEKALSEQINDLTREPEECERTNRAKMIPLTYVQTS